MIFNFTHHSDAAMSARLVILRDALVNFERDYDATGLKRYRELAIERHEILREMGKRCAAQLVAESAR